MDLPITSRSILNGCGGSTVKELVHWNLDEDKITSGIWYRHRVIYDKYNPGTGGDGEVKLLLDSQFESERRLVGQGGVRPVVQQEI